MGMGNGDSYQLYTLCPARQLPLGDVSPIPFPLPPFACRIVEFESLIILEISLHLYLEHRERNSRYILYFRYFAVSLIELM